MTNDLESGLAIECTLAGTLTEEARMAILHANALAAYVDAELKSETIFPSRVEGEEYEVVVRKRTQRFQTDLLG